MWKKYGETFLYLFPKPICKIIGSVVHLYFTYTVHFFRIHFMDYNTIAQKLFNVHISTNTSRTKCQYFGHLQRMYNAVDSNFISPVPHDVRILRFRDCICKGLRVLLIWNSLFIINPSLPLLETLEREKVRFWNPLILLSRAFFKTWNHWESWSNNLITMGTLNSINGEWQTFWSSENLKVNRNKRFSKKSIVQCNNPNFVKKEIKAFLQKVILWIMSMKFLMFGTWEYHRSLSDGKRFGKYHC